MIWKTDLQLFGGNGARSGAGGGGGNGGQAGKQEPHVPTHDELQTHLGLYEQLKKAEASLKTPSKRDIDKEFKKAVKDGRFSQADYDSWQSLYKNGNVNPYHGENYLSDDFLSYGRGYQIQTNNDKLSVRDLFDLRDMSTRGESSKEQQSVARDFGAFMLGMGKYSYSNNSWYDAAKESFEKYSRDKNIPTDYWD